MTGGHVTHLFLNGIVCHWRQRRLFTIVWKSYFVMIFFLSRSDAAECQTLGVFVVMRSYYRVSQMMSYWFLFIFYTAELVLIIIIFSFNGGYAVVSDVRALTTYIFTADVFLTVTIWVTALILWCEVWIIYVVHLWLKWYVLYDLLPTGTQIYMQLRFILSLTQNIQKRWFQGLLMMNEGLLRNGLLSNLRFNSYLLNRLFLYIFLNNWFPFPIIHFGYVFEDIDIGLNVLHFEFCLFFCLNMLGHCHV